MKKEDGISVIVPVYNSEKYLDKCLDSLLKQKIDNYEILVIDDGSTDNSSKIADSFAKKDKKVRVFHKENRGVGSARNYGLEKARYKYISFVDSDDWVTDDYLMTFYNKMNEGYDLVCLDAYEIPDGWKEEDAKYRKCFVSSGEDTKKDFIMQSMELPFSWCRCFNYKLFDDIKFPSSNEFFEDSATVPLLILKASKLCYVEKACYYYRQHSKSIVRQKNDKRNIGIIHAWERLLKEYSDQYIKEIEYAIYYSLYSFIKYRPNLADEFMSFFKKYEKRFKSNTYIKSKIDQKEFDDVSKIELVPKKIHYFWFGGKKPEDVISYIETWKMYASDYEIIEWNESNCNVNENKYVKEAYEAKKYAFVADYFRLKILYEQGGIYLDTDMELKREIDFLRLNELSFPLERNTVCAGFISCVPKNKIIKEILDGYKNDSFILNDNSYNYKTIVERITEVISKYYKVPYDCETVIYKDLVLYAPDVFIIDIGNGHCVAEHHYKATWWDLTEGLESFRYEVLKYFFEAKFKQKMKDIIVTSTMEKRRIRFEEEQRRLAEEQKQRELAYERSFKRRLYKFGTKVGRVILPKKIYNFLKKVYRKVKPLK